MYEKPTFIFRFQNHQQNYELKGDRLIKNNPVGISVQSAGFEPGDYCFLVVALTVRLREPGDYCFPVIALTVRPRAFRHVYTSNFLLNL